MGLRVISALPELQPHEPNSLTLELGPSGPWCSWLTHTPFLCPQLYDMFWEIMQYFPGSHNHLYNLIEELKDFIASRVKINEASFDPSNPRDFIDCFLIKMYQVIIPYAILSDFWNLHPCHVKPILQLLEEKRKNIISYSLLQRNCRNVSHLHLSNELP